MECARLYGGDRTCTYLKNPLSRTGILVSWNVEHAVEVCSMISVFDKRIHYNFIFPAGRRRKCYLIIRWLLIADLWFLTLGLLFGLLFLWYMYFYVGYSVNSEFLGGCHYLRNLNNSTTSGWYLDSRVLFSWKKLNQTSMKSYASEPSIYAHYDHSILGIMLHMSHMQVVGDDLHLGTNCIFHLTNIPSKR